MKYTIYIKKEIKSKADLPKVDDLYFVHSKNSGKQTKFSFHENAHVWMKNIDYYLQPIELDLLDDEVICKLAKDRYRESSNSSDKINSYCDGMELLRDYIINQLK